MKRNIITAFIVIFISIVGFLVYTDLSSNADTVNQQVVELAKEKPEVATNEVEED